jgi:hypothetical protein
MLLGIYIDAMGFFNRGFGFVILAIDVVFGSTSEMILVSTSACNGKGEI